MIPPELRERLIRGLTQKLVDSPTFNNLVRTFHHTLDNFAQGIEEGRTGTSSSKPPPPPESEAPPSSHDTWQSREQPQQQQQQQQQQTSQQERGAPHRTAEPQQEQRQRSTRPPQQEHSQPEPATSSDAKLNELQAYLARIRSGLQEAEQRAEEQKRKQK